MSFNLNFGAQVDEWTKQSKARMLAVYKGSVQELISRAQSRIPVDTGFARSSIRASFEAMPAIVDGKNEGKVYDWASIFLVVNQVKPGQTIYIGWTANYTIYLEWGHSDQAPNGFIGITALEWQQIVAAEIEKAKVSVTR